LASIGVGGELAGLGEVLGDLAELEVESLGCASERIEGVVRGMRSRSIKMPLAWPMTSLDDSASWSWHPSCSRVVRSRTARAATEACAARTSPISHASTSKACDELA
jgi:hypothetical protein